MKFAKLVRYKNTGKSAIKIVFTYSEDDLCFVRTLPGRKYYKDLQCWGAPLCLSTVEALVSRGFDIDDGLRDYLVRTKIDTKDISENIDIPGLNGILRPFQGQGVRFLDMKNGRAFIADEMGLGKTVQALAWLQLHPEIRPAVVVCPATLKGNWKLEARKWLENPRAVILTNADLNKPLKGDLWIINYDILGKWLKRLQRLPIQALILDEAHYIKNLKSKRTKAVKSLGHKIPHIIGLSGTAILNRPLEIFNIINLIDPTLFPNRLAFLNRYCGAKYNGFGWNYNGHSNTKELHTLLTNSVMIRRLKVDVATELPPKVFVNLPMDIDNRKEYTYAEKHFIAFCKAKFSMELEVVDKKLTASLKSFMKQHKIKDIETMDHILTVTDAKKLQEAKIERIEAAPVLTQIEALKQLAANGKLKQCIEWIDNFLQSGKKLVVMATHKEVIDTLMAAFPKISVKIDGSVPVQKRQAIKEAFQNNPKIRLFVGNIKAAGEGLTLTAASDIFILEWPWGPGLLDQAIDRVHRISQQHKVTVYYSIAVNTIEEKLVTITENKRRVLAAVLDGAEVPMTSVLADIIKEYKFI